jgi:hypothetical protein
METANVDLSDHCELRAYQNTLMIAKKTLLKKGLPLELVREVLLQLHKDNICELAENSCCVLDNSIPLEFTKSVNTPERCEKMLQLISLQINSDCSTELYSDDLDVMIEQFDFVNILAFARDIMSRFGFPCGFVWKVMNQLRNYMLCCLGGTVESEREEIGEGVVLRLAKARLRAVPYKAMLNLIQLDFEWSSGSFVFPEHSNTPLDPPVSLDPIYTATYCNISSLEFTAYRSTYATPWCAGYLEISGKIYRLINPGEGCL